MTQPFFMRSAMTLIRLGGCPGWSESLLGAQVICWFCHVADHSGISLNRQVRECCSTYQSFRLFLSLSHLLRLFLLRLFQFSVAEKKHNTEFYYIRRKNTSIHYQFSDTTIQSCSSGFPILYHHHSLHRFCRDVIKHHLLQWNQNCDVKD